MLEHVQGRPAKPPRLEGAQQRRLVDELPAAHVHQDGIILHPRQLAVTDHVHGRRRLRRGDDDDVR